MALTRQPIDVLEIIVSHVLPEGFESIALTCQRIYAACKPLIQHHNTLRSHFQIFTYFEKMADPSFTIRSAFDLIARIAVEPIVARYVRHADFSVDSVFLRGRPREFNPDIHCGDSVVSLFAGSPDLIQAGLDWREYYAVIEDDLQAARYSQHASAFLLTLLPNVQTLTLPQKWKPLAATDKLVGTVVHKAKRSPYLSCHLASLAQTTRFEPPNSLGPESSFDLAWASPFLALPHVRSFRGPSCVALEDGGHGSTYVPKNPYCDSFGEMLVAVHLVNCCVDHVGIANFLKHTKRLKTLRYSHSTKNSCGPDQRVWDICKFITAIEDEAGSLLEELSVTISELRGSIPPGRTSMRRFHRLRKLQLSLQVATCNIAAATASRATNTPAGQPVVGGGSADHPSEVDNDQPFISHLVPASVSQLALISTGANDHAKTLDVMFQHFAARKASQLPALEEIQLSCLHESEDAYKEQCAKLQAEIEKAGVDLLLMQWPSSCTITWDGQS